MKIQITMPNLPKWVQWIAWDDDGTCCYFQSKPCKEEKSSYPEEDLGDWRNEWLTKYTMAVPEELQNLEPGKLFTYDEFMDKYEVKKTTNLDVVNEILSKRHTNAEIAILDLDRVRVTYPDLKLDDAKKVLKLCKQLTFNYPQD